MTDYWLTFLAMDANTHAYIQTKILTISEVAAILGLSVAAAMKRAERGGWDYVLKGRQKLYWRDDFPSTNGAVPRKLQ